MPPLPDGTPEVRRAEHGGAHPYLVDAFVRAAVGGPAPWVDVRRSAAWTAPGICAHDSSLAGGVPVQVPQY